MSFIERKKKSETVRKISDKLWFAYNYLVRNEHSINIESLTLTLL